MSRWWRSDSPWQGDEWQGSTWWRDPEFDLAWAQARATEQFGTAQQPGASSGQRAGYQVMNYTKAGQTRGASGTAQEQFAKEQTYRVDVPVNLKECGFWWTDLKELALHTDIHVSYRAKRYSKEGPGWYTLTCTGPGGHEFIEEGLKLLFRWRPDLDIESVQLPDLEDPFPTTAVKDALNNVKEYLIHRPEGMTLVDANSLSVRVASSRGVLVLRSAQRRRVRRRTQPQGP